MGPKKAAVNKEKKKDKKDDNESGNEIVSTAFSIKSFKIFITLLCIRLFEYTN